MKKIKIAIAGARGYTGIELIRILLNHKNAEIKYLFSSQNDNSKIEDSYRFLKKDNLDYEHGTGHGVGFFSNVHEGPQAISRNNKIKHISFTF